MPDMKQSLIFKTDNFKVQSGSQMNVIHRFTFLHALLWETSIGLYDGIGCSLRGSLQIIGNFMCCVIEPKACKTGKMSCTVKNHTHNEGRWSPEVDRVQNLPSGSLERSAIPYLPVNKPPANYLVS